MAALSIDSAFAPSSERIMVTASNSTEGVPASCPSAAIFLRVIEQSLSAHCPGAARVDKAALHIGAVAFIHRFGSSLNAHVHFHVCVVDGAFEVVPGEADADAQATAPSVIFHPASGVDETTVAQVQADLRRRILRAFVGRGLIERVDAKEMLAYQHSGFSVNASVCIEAHDRAAQALTRALSVGGFDRSHLRGFSADVPNMRRADAPDRVHYRGCADEADPGPHRCRLTSPAHSPGARATALGGL